MPKPVDQAVSTRADRFIMTFDAIRSDSDSSVSTALPFRLSVLDKSPVAPFGYVYLLWR